MRPSSSSGLPARFLLNRGQLGAGPAWTSSRRGCCWCGRWPTAEADLHVPLLVYEEWGREVDGEGLVRRHPHLRLVTMRPGELARTSRVAPAEPLAPASAPVDAGTLYSPVAVARGQRGSADPLGEAWRLFEDGTVAEAALRAYVFEPPLHLLAEAQPDFWSGTPLARLAHARQPEPPAVAA